MEEYKNFIIELLSYLAVFAGGIIGTIITAKWVNKEIVLTKRLFVQRVAYSSNSATWGKIDVLYNGGACNNLHLITVEIHNESNRSVEDIDVVFIVEELNTFYANSGQYKQDEIYTPLILSADYFDYFKDVAERNKTIDQLDEESKTRFRAEIDNVTRQKKYHIPVFNKKGVGVFSFLIDNATNSEPNLLVNVIKKDVRIIPYQEEEERKEIQTKWVNILTFIAFIAVSYPIAKFSPNIIWAVLLMIANASVTYYLCLGIYRIVIWCKNFLN